MSVTGNNRLVPPYPGRSFSNDIMLRELYSRVERVETILRIEQDGNGEGPVETDAFVRLHKIRPLRFKHLTLDFNSGWEHNSEGVGRENPSIFSPSGSWSLLDIKAHILTPVQFQGGSFPVGSVAVRVGTGSNFDVSSRFARGVWNLGSHIGPWIEIPLSLNAGEPVNRVDNFGRVFGTTGSAAIFYGTDWEGRDDLSGATGEAWLTLIFVQSGISGIRKDIFDFSGEPIAQPLAL